MEKINDSLRKMAPMLPPCEDLDTKSKISNKKELSKIINEQQSQFSLPLTNLTKRSNFTMLTLKTQNTALTKFPKERSLKEMAEKRIFQN